MQNTSAPTELGRLLDDLVGSVAGTRHAVVLSTDGLVVEASPELSDVDAEALSATASALHGLARGTGTRFSGGSIRQTVVEMDHAFLFVTAANAGTCVAVLGDEHADVGRIAYEINLFVQRAGAAIASAPRSRLDPAAAS
ncbi:MAG: roadblock/LC7 domain-containing protein [Saccharopolyspora sp.]|uniref:roadblock/LC7 domain-containing protein n=1 Tax=Saccharopolyspora TaxID=1835 RepID=UPI00190DC6C3|nr:MULTISPECIES: roadblock/LC7 domain-containing protein [unclassified Saccharopolyspora]MBK0870617.1 roadblock/LC7 domain-containing protein [Saccharopolyspora sp. HNM0986]MBQ6642813.1 roadblock/LC7 domain-containing protein [Saccharopolyspora sp.]